MRNELMRRISDALDSDEGLASDAELTKLLATDKVAGRYARDLARVNRWLATWPAGAPIDAQMAALATRIEQRLAEPLVRHDDATAPPEFDDDDALAETTAALTRGGGLTKAKAAEGRGAVVPMPAAAARARTPKLSVAKVAIAKQPALGGVHEEKLRAPDPRTADPISSPPPATPVAEAALVAQALAPDAPPEASPPLSADAPPLSDPGIVLSNPGIEISPEELARIELAAGPKAPAAPSAAPPPPPSADPEASPAGLAPAKLKKPSERPPVGGASAPRTTKKKKRGERDSGDRFSFPMPEPVPLGAPRFGEAAPTQQPIERRGSYGMWGGLAAAAVIFLGVAVAMRSGSDESASTVALAPGAAARAPVAAVATATVLPSEASEAPEAPAAGAMAFAEPEELLARDRADDLAAGLVAEAAPAAPRRAFGDDVASGEATPSARSRPAGASPGSADVDTARAVRGAREGGAGADAVGADGVGEASVAGSGGSAPAAPAVPAPPPTPSTATPEATAPTGGARAGAASGREPADPPAADEDLPAHPDRERVQAALSGVAGAVAACAEGEHGTASVFVVVVSSGRVTIATVSGRFSGTPVGSCIARAVRAARFPPFTEARFEVTYPYSF